MSDKDQAAQGAMAVLSPEVAEAYRSLQKGDLNGCESRCKEVLARDGQHADALHLLGIVECASGRTDQGIATLKNAVRARPDHSVYRLTLGRQLASRGEDRAAIDEFSAAVKNAPRMAQAFYEMGQCLDRLGEQSRAIEAYGKAVNARGDFAPAHYALAGALRRAGKHDEAIERYQQAVSARPEFGEAHYNLGLLLRDLDRLEEAEQSLARATELLSEFAPAHMSRGAVLASLHRYPEAESCLHRALELTPDDSNALTNLGNVLLFQNRPDEALHEFEKALKLEPDSPSAQLGVGLALRGQLRVSEAIPAIERALELDPDSVQSMYALAEAHDRTHQWDEAASWAKRAIEKKQSHLASRMLLARIDREAGRLEESDAALRDLLAEAPRDMMKVRVLKEMGHLCRARGNSADAVAKYNEAAAIWNALPEIQRMTETSLAQTLASYPDHLSESVVSTWEEEPVDDGRASPLILCGFPRAGVTVVEQMLASFPGVIATDEAPILNPVLMHVAQTAGAYRPYPECLDDLLDDQIEQCRSIYWEAAARLATGAAACDLLVDKHMMNLVHLGLYRRIFPDAKVLMVTRDPRDIIAECYIEYHTPSQATASFGSIPGIAESVQAYDALWQFAKSTFGMASMEVRYEDVVNDPARSMRRIAEWLGLSWDDGATKPDRRVRGKALRSHAYREIAGPISDRYIGVGSLFSSEIDQSMNAINPYMKAHGYE
ncbi:MAG: tetratricopeptide repeat protein [Phycisphaerales bacterium]